MAEKAVSTQETYWSWGSADIHRHDLDSFRTIQFSQATQHNANLSATTTATTAVQNPSVNELHMVQGETKQERTS